MQQELILADSPARSTLYVYRGLSTGAGVYIHIYIYIYICNACPTLAIKTL